MYIRINVPTLEGERKKQKNKNRNKEKGSKRNTQLLFEISSTNFKPQAYR
jgi:hypothetical protein